MKNKGFYNLLLLLILGAFMPCWARKHQIALPSAYDQPSFVVNEDSTVLFCYCSPVKRVSVLGDFQYSGKDSTRYNDMRTRKIRMHRASDGCFHATTKQLVPETYTYCFRINGKRKPDSYNNDTAWQMTHKWNIVTVGGTAQTALYQQPAQRGTILHTSWYSSTEKLNRRVNIYLPAGYSNTLRYPVLYLLHGISGYEGSWSERGRAIQILENLVAQGKCQPMILVMPDVNVKPQEGKPTHRSLFNNIMNYSRLCHDHDIERAVVELTAFVDSTFRVSDDHYIAGLSDGARMAANTANLLPNYFSTVGLFSPVVHKQQLPKDSATYYVYSGKKDMFHANAKRFNRRLDKAQAPHEYTETIGGHTWRNWRLYLSDFMVKINQ